MPATPYTLSSLCRIVQSMYSAENERTAELVGGPNPPVVTPLGHNPPQWRNDTVGPKPPRSKAPSGHNPLLIGSRVCIMRVAVTAAPGTRPTSVMANALLHASSEARSAIGKKRNDPSWAASTEARCATARTAVCQRYPVAWPLHVDRGSNPPAVPNPRQWSDSTETYAGVCVGETAAASSVSRNVRI